MPPVFGSLIAVVAALVILRGGERHDLLARCAMTMKLTSSPRRNSSITTVLPAAPKLPPSMALRGRRWRTRASRR